MALTSDQIAPQVAKLMPRGAAWVVDMSAKLYWLWQAAADEMSRLYSAVDDLRTEAHPSTGEIDQLLPEWEADWGLPESYVTVAQTNAERNAAILSKMRQVGGQSPGYYIGIAAALGATITITEGLAPNPFIVGVDGPPHTVGGGVANPFVWTVNASASLSTSIQQSLEGALTRLRPAHTTVVFSYT